eukprot:GHVQ01012097.1.p1 GENE.GHVQ01012097.1~~GHVQ01012097.1.p1  ORF type:complete len:150 (+),score=13.13 GHVQ01012097.1:110-559(+)
MYIPQFAEKARGLTDLMKTAVDFKWSEDAEYSFKHLKRALTTQPVLAIPDFDKPFVVTTDGAVTNAIGGWIGQKDDDGKLRPIAYVSHKLSEAETRWTPYEVELYAVVYCIKQFRPYVLGRPFVLRTDNQAVEGLKSSRPVTDQPKLCR